MIHITTADTGAAHGPERPGLAARGAQRLIYLYQVVMDGRISHCRYLPTCSSYALEAYEVHGFAKGSWLTARRIGRCHPWGGHGLDPVPPKKAN